MRRYRYFLKWLLVLLAVILAAILCLDMCFYKNYQDKMHILAQMYESDEQSKLDTAITLLKSGEDLSDAVQMEDVLKQYGYCNNLRNRYYSSFVKQCAGTAAGSIILVLTVLFLACRQEKRWHSVQEQYFKELERCLLGFRENKRTKQDIMLMRDTADGLEDAADRVNDQLVMLEEYLTIMREQSYTEKEGTKRLVTDISHQLKAPVAALDTCFSVLTDQELNNEERDEFYQRCRNELEGLKQLLHSLIQISQMEAGMIQIKCRKTPILDTIVAAVNRIYPKVSARQLELVFDYAPDIEQLIVEHDAQWLCEAFINILDNAVKYSPSGSEIRIIVQQYYSFVRIEINDQGIGIPKQDYHKVFQRFYRGSSRQVREESGSGVGLYLAREIVGRHHGLISVHSDYEKRKKNPGSRFVVQIPLGTGDK